MTNRELRTRRRAAERKVARKAAQTAHRQDATNPPAETQQPNYPAAELAPVLPPKNEIGFVSQPSPRVRANRQNAQASTGPLTPAGKLASSRNSLKHGLSTGERIIAGENSAHLEALLAALLNEYQPATVTEELLVKEMAESHWLTQRALRLQNDCFTAEGVDQKRLALFLRYQTTHQRAFHKALAALGKMQKERRKQPLGFVSQTDTPTQPHPLSPAEFDSCEPAPPFAQRLKPPATGFVSQAA